MGLSLLHARSFGRMDRRDEMKSIERVFSGSCTPGCDLEAMIEARELTIEQANAAVRARYSRISGVRELAASERAYMRDNDV